MEVSPEAASTLLIPKANGLIAVPPSPPLCGQEGPGKGWANLSLKGPIANILHFEAYAVCVQTSWEAVTDHG